MSIDLERIGASLCLPGMNSSADDEQMQNLFFCTNIADKISSQIQVLAALAFVLLMAVAITGNAIVMWIIFEHKVMHYGFNYFLFNMAFADFLIAVFNVGTTWTFNLYYDWWYGDLCTLTSFFGIAPTTVSVFSMMALSWDRCQAVVNPLHKRPLSRRRSFTWITIIWGISTVTALPFALNAQVSKIYAFEVESRKVFVRHVCSAPVDPVFDHILFCLQYALPLFVLSFTFARIAYQLRDTNPATDNNSKQNSHNRAKSKAVKMLALMVVAFMFCWLPYHLYHTFEISDWFSASNAKYIYLCIYWVAMSSSAYNPIIYCFANERFRIGFRYVFRWLPGIECKRENYEYSQLFPDKLKSLAISMQKGRNMKDSDKRNRKGIEFSSCGFGFDSTPDIVQCTLLNQQSPKRTLSPA